MGFGVAETVSPILESSSQAQGAPMLAVGKVKFVGAHPRALQLGIFAGSRV